MEIHQTIDSRSKVESIDDLSGTYLMKNENKYHTIIRRNAGKNGAYIFFHLKKNNNNNDSVTLIKNVYFRYESKAIDSWRQKNGYHLFENISGYWLSYIQVIFFSI